MTHFTQWQITDISIGNEYFVCTDFTHGLRALGFATTLFNKICVSLFASLHYCYQNDTTTVATLNFLRSGGN